MKKWLRNGCLVITILAFACGPKPETAPESLPTPAVPMPTGLTLTLLGVEELPTFTDREDHESMVRALDYQIRWTRNQAEDKIWTFGALSVAQPHLLKTLQTFRDLWQQHKDDPQALDQAVKAQFDCYRFLWDGSPDVLITGYHAPVYDGSLKPDATYRFPLYAQPKDMLVIDTAAFSERQLVKGEGRRSARVPARLERGKVLPYYSRQEIDEGGVLQGRGLELVYLKSYFEQFSFHVQGGGFVKLNSGGYLKLGYSGQNGRPYTSIGRKLVDEGIIPEDEISMQAIQAYFTKKPEEVKRVCYANESYVFYTGGKVIQALKPAHFPPGVMGFPVTSRRSIATDKRFFPAGLPAYIEGVQRQESGEAEPFSAFVVDQDTGGAIRRNHIDFFQGAGDGARHRAGLLKDERGRVTFLLLKSAQETQ